MKRKNNFSNSYKAILIKCYNRSESIMYINMLFRLGLIKHGTRSIRCGYLMVLLNDIYGFGYKYSAKSIYKYPFEYVDSGKFDLFHYFSYLVLENKQEFDNWIKCIRPKPNYKSLELVY